MKPKKLMKKVVAKSELAKQAEKFFPAQSNPPMAYIRTPFPLSE